MMNTKVIKLSIITVTYNAAKDLTRTLNSIFSQTFTDYELIIIDGKSTDNTVEIIKNHQEKINYWISEEDKGIYDAMNKAISHSKGDYLQFLNAGDFFFNDEVLINFFAEVKGNPALLYGDIQVLALNANNFFQKAYDFTFENLLTLGTGVLCHQAMFVKREIIPAYSTKYCYKGELNWYFDLVESDNFSYQHIDIPIINYSLGGFGHNNFIKNQFEWLKLIYDRFGIITLLKSKMIGSLLIDVINRYSLLKKPFLLITKLSKSIF